VTQPSEPNRSCPRCAKTIVEVLLRIPGRPRRWCSAKCRRSASEERRAAEAGAIAKEYVQVEVSLDDQVSGVLASAAACRRVLRGGFEDGTLDEARWSSVAEELRRTRPEPRPSVRWGAR
jgi:hypothetical protein